jgi:hypothetical protein
MSNLLGLGFNRPYLRTTAYRPQAYFWEEDFQRWLRFALAQLLTNQYALPIRVVVDASQPPGEEGVEQPHGHQNSQPDTERSPQDQGS